MACLKSLYPGSRLRKAQVFFISKIGEPMQPKQIPFDPELSIQLDRAMLAVEDAEANEDDVRLVYAQAWKRRLEAVIFQEQEDERRAL